MKGPWRRWPHVVSAWPRALTVCALLAAATDKYSLEQGRLPEGPRGALFRQLLPEVGGGTAARACFGLCVPRGVGRQGRGASSQPVRPASCPESTAASGGPR
jgi:hypothetical protein